MKRILIAALIVIAAVWCVSCKKDNKGGKDNSVVKVNGEELSYKTGDLESILADKEVTSLEWVSGEIGGKDIDAMRTYCVNTLKVLDMEKASFALELGEYATGIYDSPTSKIYDITVVPYAMCYKYTKLESVKLPEGVKTIDMFAFGQCSSLSEVSIPDAVTEIGSYAFITSGLKDVNLPSSLKTIGIEAFYSVPLESLLIPENVTSFYDDTFIYSGESKLRIVVCRCMNPPVIFHSSTINQKGNVFNIVPSNFQITVPGAALAHYKGQARWCEHANQIKGSTQF